MDSLIQEFWNNFLKCFLSSFLFIVVLSNFCSRLHAALSNNQGAGSWKWSEKKWKWKKGVFKRKIRTKLRAIIYNDEEIFMLRIKVSVRIRKKLILYERLALQERKDEEKKFNAFNSLLWSIYIGIKCMGGEIEST